jgi:Na+/phosphate symporter
VYTASPVRPATGRPVLVVVTRVLAALFGALKLVATTFFLFFSAATAPQSVGDWLVGVWSIVIGLAYLGVAARLGRDSRVLPAMAGLAVADVAFSMVKFFVYDETAPIPFTAATLVLLALVVAAARPRRTA